MSDLFLRDPQWKDASKGYGSHKTLYNRLMRSSQLGVFQRIFAGLAGEGPKPERIMIDTTYLTAQPSSPGSDQRVLSLDPGTR